MRTSIVPHAFHLSCATSANFTQKVLSKSRWSQFKSWLVSSSRGSGTDETLNLLFNPCRFVFVPLSTLLFQFFAASSKQTFCSNMLTCLHTEALIACRPVFHLSTVHLYPLKLVAAQSCQILELHEFNLNILWVEWWAFKHLRFPNRSRSFVSIPNKWYLNLNRSFSWCFWNWRTAKLINSSTSHYIAPLGLAINRVQWYRFSSMASSPAHLDRTIVIGAFAVAELPQWRKAATNENKISMFYWFIFLTFLECPGSWQVRLNLQWWPLRGNHPYLVLQKPPENSIARSYTSGANLIWKSSGNCIRYFLQPFPI